MSATPEHVNKLGERYTCVASMLCLRILKIRMRSRHNVQLTNLAIAIRVALLWRNIETPQCVECQVIQCFHSDADTGL